MSSHYAKKYLGSIVPIVFYALLIIFLFSYLKSIDTSKLSEIDLVWEYVILASILAIGFRYFGAFIWFILLKSLGAKQIDNKRELAYVYAKSWLGRYIPGTAPWILGKIYFASKQGISKNKLAVSSLLEGALQIVVTLVLSLMLLAFDSRLDVISIYMKWLMLGVAITGLIALSPPIFNRILRLTYRLIRKKEFNTSNYIDSHMIIRGASLYAFGAIMAGLSLFFIAKSVYGDLGYSELLFVMGVSSLASAVSMLAIFAPSGLGVREGIQVLLLSLIMPVEFALLIAVVTRIWSVVMDTVFYGLTSIFRHK